MYIESEIRELRSLYDNLPKETLEQFLSKDEVDLIKEKGLTYQNLRNDIFVPKNYERPETCVRFQRLNTEKFDIAEWMDEISYKIRYSPDMLVQMGYSFIARIGHTNQKSYMFCPKGLAAFNRKISTPEDWDAFTDEIKNMKEPDLLSKVFWDALDENRFRRSGWCPSKLVCNYIWITK